MPTKPKKKIQILEVGGRGGVFQHSLAVCIALAEAGHEVTLHTATDPEIEDDRVILCHCFTWRRDQAHFRGAAIALSFLFATVPHLLRQHGIFWVQGLFKSPLTFLLLAVLRLLHRPALFSPHNLFPRYGGRLELLLVGGCFRLAKRVITYNVEDAAKLASMGIDQSRVTLMMYTPIVTEPVISQWREKINQIGAGVCAVGQIRADKNLPMLVEAAAEANVPLLIMGPDTGSAKDVEACIANHPGSSIAFYEGFFPLEDLAAVIAITGTVALPYSIASQSGVAVLAKAYGAKVIAYGVGGLKEQADISLNTLSRLDWAHALKRHAKHDPNRTVPMPLLCTPQELQQLEALFSGVKQ